MTDLLFEQQRATALRADCEHCREVAGKECVSPRTGNPLEHQAAHFVRIQAGARKAEENA